MAREWMGLRLQAEMVTLSACRSGFSEVGRGDEMVGMTRALLYAGARSTLLTLWSVNAGTTLEWMKDFYNRVWVGDGQKLKHKAFAFQEATLALRRRYPNPYIWAPFILVGAGS
jgi:CHAT domain-containing protein